MRTARISEYRSNLSNFHKSVLTDHEALRIVGGSRGDVVVVPAADYDNLLETINILKDKATMNSLLENRIDYQGDAGQGISLEEAFRDALESHNK